MSGSLQINGIDWKVSLLGEQALFMKSEDENANLAMIHESAKLLEKADLKGLTDIISAYDSIALIFDRLLEESVTEAEKLQSALNGLSLEKIPPQKHRVPVCYELGLDWQQVEKHTGLARQEIIKKHTTPKYVAAMMGFIPGFIYLEGLDKKIFCPRKANPRTKIPEGSVGIAGEQTGVYSLESPGGWQIIGRTTDSFFDANKEPPSRIEPGDIVEFYNVSEAEFRALKADREVS